MVVNAHKKGYLVTNDEYDEAAAHWTSREVTAKRMPEDELRAEIDAFLSSHNTCALACGSGDFVRCTPLEYAWRGGALWIFSEGGLKFRALKENKNVRLAVFDPCSGFGKLASMQVTGVAELIDSDAPEFADAVAAKGLPAQALPKLRGMLHLIRIAPMRIDLLCSDLKSRGYDSRQWIEL